MTDGSGLILGVGDCDVMDALNCCFDYSTNGKLLIGSVVDSVSDAIKEIDSGKYSGLVMNSLLLGIRSGDRKLIEEVNKFAYLDTSIYVSGGLYIVNRASREGLVCIVNQVAEEERELREAERLGARVFSIREGGSVFFKNLDYFVEQLDL